MRHAPVPFDRCAGRRCVRGHLRGGGPAQELLISCSKTLPEAVNLCASSVRKGELSDDDMLKLIQKGEGLVL